ncbi:piggyBac transposable element-derived protein 4-like [Stegodyphus dumicola]|uniref:piggyBac transposable element-derived protein 4-like n=1 Tax=Stegodyphus dumicola TaxID=202533 RepID=UPI0015B30043|nr:piggyBac transposable element-derived protein 4-like [Stegodyphus dumicola]
MIAFNGRTSLKQYMPMKTIKRSYKVWCLANSKTGYIQKFEIYCGKETSDNKDKILSLGKTLITKLTEDVKQTGHLIAYDNYLTSFRLAKSLLISGLFSAGTIRLQRKDLSPILKANNKLLREKSVFLAKEGVAAIKWMDKKAVILLTTAHNSAIITSVNHTKKDGTKTEIPCRKAVAVYNDIVGRVDCFDQRNERYQIGRRSVEWWRRIFYFLTDLGIVNSFILWQVNKRNRSLDQLTFRIALALSTN